VQQIADISGDWREEIVTFTNGELRIYSTTIPAKDRRVSPMQDPIYRHCVTTRTMAYSRVPQASYYLGEK
jgi:rhamnogalacturonan endolyase